MRTNGDFISSGQSTQCPHCERLKSCSKGFCLTVVTQHQIRGIWSQSALTTLLNFLQGRLTWTQVRIFNFDLCHSVNFPFFFLSHGFKISIIILLKVWFFSHNYPEGKIQCFLICSLANNCFAVHRNRVAPPPFWRVGDLILQSEVFLSKTLNILFSCYSTLNMCDS